MGGLAGAIDAMLATQGTAPESHPLLVPLRPNGSEAPLFCVHAVGGSAAPFLPLAARLDGERPIYGLEAVGLYDGDPLESVEEMASAYLTEIDRVHPDGPCHLLGWSGGGLIAIEVANQLSGLGREVDSLILLDTNLPQGGRLPDHAELLSYFVRDVAAQADVDTVVIDLAGLRDRPDDEQRTLVLKLLEDAGLAPAGIDAQLRARLRVFIATSLAVRKYRPKTPLHSKLTVVSAARGRPMAEVLRDWEAAGVTVSDHVVVPGTHYTMVREPHVQAVSAIVRDRLDVVKQTAADR